jgi:RNA polymerase sigma-70 factor (ECF subfamily)
LNQSEFLKFTRKNQDNLFRIAKRLLVSHDAAQDAVQEVWLKLWKNREKLDKLDSPAAFAVTVTKNHCLDQLKLKNNNNLRIVHSNYETRSKSPDAELEAKDELKKVGEIIKGLSKKEQMLIQLREIEQLDYAEMASVLNMRENTIRVGLSRTRKKNKKSTFKTTSLWNGGRLNN